MHNYILKNYKNNIFKLIYIIAFLKCFIIKYKISNLLCFLFLSLFNDYLKPIFYKIISINFFNNIKCFLIIKVEQKIL